MRILTSIFRHTTCAMLLAGVALLASCGASRKVTKTDDEVIAGTSMPQADKLTRTIMEKVQENCQTSKGIQGKVSVTLSGLSASGTLKMRHDEIIQISLSAMLGLMEIGRLEMTPEYLFIQDRYNHQYVKARWEDITHLRAAGINFYTFQGLFWGELFVPGKTTKPEMTDFEAKEQGGEVSLQPKMQDTAMLAMTATFIMETAMGLIKQVEVVTPQSSSLQIKWAYSDWARVAGKPFPAEMKMGITSGGATNATTFKFSNLQANDELRVTPTPTPGSNYSTININQMLRRLLK